MADVDFEKRVEDAYKEYHASIGTPEYAEKKAALDEALAARAQNDEAEAYAKAEAARVEASEKAEKELEASKKEPAPMNPGGFSPVEMGVQDTKAMEWSDYLNGHMGGSTGTPFRFEYKISPKEYGEALEKFTVTNASGSSAYVTTSLTDTLLVARNRVQGVRAAGAMVEVISGNNTIKLPTLSDAGKANIVTEGASNEDESDPNTGSISLPTQEYRDGYVLTYAFMNSNPFGFENRAFGILGTRVERKLNEVATTALAAAAGTNETKTIDNAAAFAGDDAVADLIALRQNYLGEDYIEDGVWTYRSMTHGKILGINSANRYQLFPEGARVTGFGGRPVVLERPVYYNKEVDQFGTALAEPILYYWPQAVVLRDSPDVVVLADPSAGAKYGGVKFWMFAWHGAAIANFTNNPTVAKLKTTGA